MQRGLCLGLMKQILLHGLSPFFMTFPSHTFLSIFQIFRAVRSWWLPFALRRAGGIQQ